jgi:hypothetical protein
MNVVILREWPHARSSCRHASKQAGEGEWIDQTRRARRRRAIISREIRVALARIHPSSCSKFKLTIAHSLLLSHLRHRLTESDTYTSNTLAMPPKLSSQPLTADAKRLRTIIISFPLFVATSWILYKRGESLETSPWLCYTVIVNLLRTVSLIYPDLPFRH